MFEHLKALPQDPILGLLQLFRNDSRPEKIDLGVGVYKDAQGNTPVMNAVKLAEQRLLEQEDTKAYIGPAGAAGFGRAMAGLLLGDSFGDQFDRFIADQPNVEYVSRGRQNLAKLALGRIEYMPLGRVSGELQAAKFGYSQQIRPFDTPVATEFFYLAVRRGSGLERHLPFLNRRLREMHAHGTLKSLEKSYSERYLKQPLKSDNRP